MLGVCRWCLHLLVVIEEEELENTDSVTLNINSLKVKQWAEA